MLLYDDLIAQNTPWQNDRAIGGQNCTWHASDGDDDRLVAQDFIGQQLAENVMRHGLITATVSGE